MSERDIIQPRTLKGFRDFLPSDADARERLISTMRTVLRSYGYAPIDTPVLEYSEILLGKAGAETDRQMYRFVDGGGRDVAMRFDLTVPLARFVAQHIAEVGRPFKRYHIGYVWRAENTQRGRYREFMQCDFDTIGSTSLVADTETALVIHDTFDRLGVGEFTVRLNHRGVLGGVLAELGLTAETAAVLRAIDKLPKVGRESVARELTDAGASPEEAAAVLDTVGVTGSNAEILENLRSTAGGAAAPGIAALEEVLAGAAAAGVPDGRIQIDVSIARGLDYYTGTVFETFLTDLPEMGSVCSGGRYDDLASLYTKERLPGVGASIGVDRLLAALQQLGHSERPEAPAPIMMALFDDTRTTEYLAVAASLRRRGLGVEIYPDPKKLGAQLKYSDKKGHTLVVIIGPDEWESTTAQVKAMHSGETHSVALSELGALCEELLAATG